MDTATASSEPRTAVPVSARTDREYLRLNAETDGELSALPAGTLIHGRASEALDLLPAKSVRTVVTSPPYWSLRDYGIGDAFGRNDTLGEYVASIVADFGKLRRVLKNDGAVWLNIGDAYTSGNRRYRAPDRKNRARAMSVRPRTPKGLKPKDLIGLPWRLAFALQDDGWWLRSEVIWYKRNAHPESVGDRPTKAHETVFLLSKRQDYYDDVKAVRGANNRRLRTVWNIPTSPRRRDQAGDDHPPMPIELARRCVALTSEPGDVVLDPYAGPRVVSPAGWRGCPWPGPARLGVARHGTPGRSGADDGRRVNEPVRESGVDAPGRMLRPEAGGHPGEAARIDCGEVGRFRAEGFA